MEVSVRELKSRLSEYLRRVADGEELLVTSRGKTVARLMPPPRRVRKAAASDDTEAIEALRRLPWVRLGTTGKQRVGLDRPAKLEPGTRLLSETVSEMRD